MAAKAIRFAITSENSQYSQSWKIWTQKNNCYMGSRGMAQDYKASFHESGQCQIGLSSEIRKSLVIDPSWEGKSRLLDVWQVENDVEYGEKVRLIELLFPFSHLDKFNKPISGNEIELRCGIGEISSVAVFRARMGADSIVKSGDQSVSEVGRLPLNNGQWIVVLHRVLDETEEYLDFFAKSANSFKLPYENSDDSGRTYQKGDIDLNKPGLRLMLGYKNNDSRYWIEMSHAKLLAART
jgi:hypothetical protein